MTRGKKREAAASQNKQESSDFDESSFYMSLSGVFSLSVFGIPKQHKQTAGTCHSTAPDTVET